MNAETWFKSMIEHLDECGGIEANLSSLHTNYGNFKGILIDAHTLDGDLAGSATAKDIEEIMKCLIIFLIYNEKNNYTFQLVKHNGDAIGEEFDFTKLDATCKLIIKKERH